MKYDKIIIESDPAGLAQKGAEIFSKAATKSFEEKRRFVVAISGGSTPRGMHRILGEEPFRSNIPWENTNLFWVDERCVPENDPASNYVSAKEDFIEGVPIPEAQVYPMQCEGSPEYGAILYNKKLIAFFQSEQGESPVFDIIFLGIGTDGHTASLFPGQSALKEKSKWVVAVKGGNPDVSRLTMTFPLLNQARQIVFLVSGKGKSGIVKIIFENRDAGLPAQGIEPISRKLIWLLDQEAASLL